MPTALTNEEVYASHSGVVTVGTTTSETMITESTAIDGTLILTITALNSDVVNLEGIVVTIDEYIPPAVQVTSVSSSGATTDTYSDLAGGVAIDGVVDLSGITFNTGETTLTLSMTSLNANYIKNNVSWVNTSGVTISSTSLYLPQNPSEELTSGKSKDLTIYVNNNTGSATTISGLEVAFEEKTDLLQASEEASTYTGERYWYVEMGTYSTTTDNVEGKRESEYLRWRYFSDTTEHYDFTETRPTGEGYFILETYISGITNSLNGGLFCSWNNDHTYVSTLNVKHNLNGWTNIDSNDYSTSNIRQYMNSEEEVSKSSSGTWNETVTPADPKSNMFTDLHIDPDNDIVYTQIMGRTLGDLYTDMDQKTTATNTQDVQLPKGASSEGDWGDATITYSSTDEDKFWLLSYYETYTLLSGNATTENDADRSWGYWYWLRSPITSSSYDVWYVSASGRLNNPYVGSRLPAARAAFKFSI